MTTERAMDRKTVQSSRKPPAGMQTMGTRLYQVVSQAIRTIDAKQPRPQA